MKNLWEKLKVIGINLPKLTGISGIRFSSLVHIDKSVKVEGNVVVINLAKITGKRRRQLKHIVGAEVLPEVGAILDETTTPTVVAALEELPSINDTLTKFAPIIPPSDLPLLQACLFLRARFEAGVPVEEMKSQIVRVYGTRGRNFANLCSAKYLEQWFWPLYEELLREHPNDPASAKSKFHQLYNGIVNDLPWTEFVSSRAKQAKVMQHIRDKMQRNLNSGVRYLNLHALGKVNVRKVLKLLPELEKQTGAIAATSERDENRIFVRLEMPRQSAADAGQEKK